MPDHARSDDAAVQTQLDRFAQLSPGRDTLGLERITELLARLGNPHQRLPPVFHVAGTNGKGSTCAFLRACIEAAGFTAHVYTSPHLVRFNERIRIAGKLIGDAALAPLLEEVLDAAGDIGPSFFEATTAAAFLAFSRTPADASIIEVGLGGRLDATNVFARPAVCGIAQLGLDHQSFLGDTLAHMATEKAGIAKRGVPLLTLTQPPEAMGRIEAAASAAGAPLFIEGRNWFLDDSLRPSLSGPHQLRNASLAAGMLRNQTALQISETAIRTGIATARWPARLQRLSPGPLRNRLDPTTTLTIDGAHNPAAALALTQSLPRAHLIIGILANKDAVGIIAPLSEIAESLTFVIVPDHPSHDPGTLATRHGGQSAVNLEAALDNLAHLQNAAVVVIGSLYLAGEALRLNRELPD